MLHCFAVQRLCKKKQQFSVLHTYIDGISERNVCMKTLELDFVFIKFFYDVCYNKSAGATSHILLSTYRNTLIKRNPQNQEFFIILHSRIYRDTQRFPHRTTITSRILFCRCWYTLIWVYGDVHGHICMLHGKIFSVQTPFN